MNHRIRIGDCKFKTKITSEAIMGEDEEYKVIFDFENSNQTISITLYRSNIILL